MSRVNLDPISFPPYRGENDSGIMFRKISRLRTEGLLREPLSELKKVAKEIALECKSKEISLSKVLEELGFENTTLKNKINATKLKTLEEVIDFLNSKEELKDFILAMESAIYEANKPRRFINVRYEIPEARQIETEPPERKVVPEIPFTPRPRPGTDFQT